jgi:hypothetical protein
LLTPVFLELEVHARSPARDTYFMLANALYGLENLGCMCKPQAQCYFQLVNLMKTMYYGYVMQEFHSWHVDHPSNIAADNAWELGAYREWNARF